MSLSMYSVVIDKTSDTPRHLQLYRKLRALIEAGDLQTGDRLLSDNEMMEAYGLSRSTVRQAVDELVRHGLVRRINGKGSFVSAVEKVFDPILVVHENPPENIRSHPFRSVLVSEFTRLGNEEGYPILPFWSHSFNQKSFFNTENVALRRYLAGGAYSGVFLMTYRIDEYYQELNRIATPLVVSSPSPFPGGLCSQIADDEVEAETRIRAYFSSIKTKRIGVLPYSLPGGGGLAGDKGSPEVVNCRSLEEAAQAGCDALLVTDDIYALAQTTVLAGWPSERLVVRVSSALDLPFACVRLEVDPFRLARLAWLRMKEQLEAGTRLALPLVLLKHELNFKHLK